LSVRDQSNPRRSDIPDHLVPRFELSDSR